MSETGALPTKYDRYANKFDVPMLVLAFVFLVVWSTRIIGQDLPGGVRGTLIVIQGWVWLAFIADIIIRTVLSEKSWKYLWTHPIDVIAVLLPPARPLKILTVFGSGTVLASKKGAVQSSQAIGISLLLLIWIGAVSILSAERGAVGAQIENFGDAIWWALVTITTVGYGDFAPVTTEGRLVATVMMFIGIALIGVVTASVAGWVVSLTSNKAAEDAEQDEEVRDHRDDAMAQRVVDLEAKIDRLLELQGEAPPGKQSQPRRPGAPTEPE
ncbi:potassium channel family protein [Demequina aurantiaca]|uniref:potassium channel family protein n=1 Tax=Demequina aurantiaca TaxID=676200 RepID=UPI0007851F57|nr:potassium channel family protein [Demequina aurantiaca]